jgi:hypothetical protein
MNMVMMVLVFKCVCSGYSSKCNFLQVLRKNINTGCVKFADVFMLPIQLCHFSSGLHTSNV